MYSIQTYELQLPYSDFLCNVTTILLLSEEMESNVRRDQSIEGRKEDLELPFFDLATIAKATNNFSIDNKLGEGGFGVVYRVTCNILV